MLVDKEILNKILGPLDGGGTLINFIYPSIVSLIAALLGAYFAFKIIQYQTYISSNISKAEYVDRLVLSLRIASQELNLIKDSYDNHISALTPHPVHRALTFRQQLTIPKKNYF